jgi:hypothetical protein
MSEITNLTATREALRELSRIVKVTQQTLAEIVHAVEQFGKFPHDSRPGQFAETLNHMEDIREGFIISQRTSPRTNLTDLRTLVQHVLMDWQWVQELNMALEPSKQIETLGSQLVAYNHALVALAVLPRLPVEVVTFPQPKPTYSDVSVPVLPEEMLARIEEIEQMIYQAEVRTIETLTYEPFRRTYAFFEASSWLVNSYLEPLLGE